ncbi:hypothetical protein ACJIZ3_024842 [Penstemon smallii]|uniref:Uncharacterized protein n=1 Tax=Penstemon smallii TaxID=265156 RepID=A0ABD3TUB1_9LAMI
MIKDLFCPGAYVQKIKKNMNFSVIWSNIIAVDYLRDLSSTLEDFANHGSVQPIHSNAGLLHLIYHCRHGEEQAPDKWKASKSFETSRSKWTQYLHRLHFSCVISASDKYVRNSHSFSETTHHCTTNSVGVFFACGFTSKKYTVIYWPAQKIIIFPRGTHSNIGVGTITIRILSPVSHDKCNWIRNSVFPK